MFSILNGLNKLPRSQLRFKSKMSKNSVNKKSKVNEVASAAVAAAQDTNKAIFLNKSGELCLTILAKPGAKETIITDVDDEVVKCSISAPPVDGEANKELIRYISKLLKLKNSDVTLDRGSKNRNKVLILSNCNQSIDELTEKLRKEAS